MDIRNFLKRTRSSESGSSNEISSNLTHETLVKSSDAKLKPVSYPQPNARKSAALASGSLQHNSASARLQSWPKDLGVEKPTQPRLNNYPAQYIMGKKRSFSSSWYIGRPWLEYSAEKDAAYCYPCRCFSKALSSDSAFTEKGFRNWKHALEKGKGLLKHVSSKDHMHCVSLWRQRAMRIETCSEITTLVHTDQLARNRYYLSSIIDIFAFLAINHLPFRGEMDSRESMRQTGCGLFLSLFQYTLEKDLELAKIAPTIPKNATYTSHEIQNEVVEIMSTMITEHIVGEIGGSFYTIKVDGTRDPTGCENISIVVRFVDENYAVKERLLTIATAEAGDARTLTHTIISEIRKKGLTTDKILSQVYDGASFMSGKRGGVQAILQHELGREIPYVHCFNHQLHLAIVHAMSIERAIEDFFGVCNALYKFTRKPTVAAKYRGITLKRLLEQRWTGHLATVSTIMKSFDSVTEVLNCILESSSFSIETKMEATGLLSSVLKPSFRFHGHMVLKILEILNQPNKMLQSAEMDLRTAVHLVNSATRCIVALRDESEFLQLWTKCTEPTACDDASQPRKRTCTANSRLGDFILEQTSGARYCSDSSEMTEQRRLFYSCIDAVVGEISRRFGEKNLAIMESISALDPDSPTFMDPKIVNPLLLLTGTAMAESEFVVARQYIKDEIERQTTPDEGKWTINKIIRHFHTTLEAMPSVLVAFKAALTFGASTSSCENSFSMLKIVFSEHRRSMSHIRKASLVQLAFEKNLTAKCRKEWKDKLLRRFHDLKNRKLQLY